MGWWAAGPQGMAIPGIARRVEPLGPLGPLGDGAAGECGKTCREKVWLPSWQPPRPPSRPAIPPPPPPGPVVGNARQKHHMAFSIVAPLSPNPAAMLSGFATPQPKLRTAQFWRRVGKDQGGRRRSYGVRRGTRYTTSPHPSPKRPPFLPLQWLHSSSAGQLVEVVAAKFASSAISSPRLYARRPHDIPNFNCGT